MMIYTEYSERKCENEQWAIFANKGFCDVTLI